MRRNVMQVFAGAVASAVVGSLGLMGVSASASAHRAQASGAAASPRAAASPGTQLWVARYNHRSVNASTANSVAVSPDGGTVFVTGYSYDNVRSFDYATVAYNAAPGRTAGRGVPGRGDRLARRYSVRPRTTCGE